MAKLAVNPRRFSKEEVDPNEDMTMHLMLRPAQGNERVCTDKLRAVLAQHPHVRAEISGVAAAGHQVKISVGVHLGTAAETLQSSDYTAAALDLVAAMSVALYDYFPRLASAPSPEEAARAASFAASAGIEHRVERRRKPRSVTAVGAKRVQTAAVPSPAPALRLVAGAVA